MGINNLKSNGLTLVELVLVMFLMVILIGSVGLIYNLNLRVLDDAFDQSFMQGDMGDMMAFVDKKLKHAKTIDAFSESSITFTADLGGGDNSYRLYLYHPSDPEPNPPYISENYSLKWAEEDVGYGDGAVIAKDIEQPTQAPFSMNGNLISIDLTEIKNDESLRLRTNIRPRNL